MEPTQIERGPPATRRARGAPLERIRVQERVCVHNALPTRTVNQTLGPAQGVLRIRTRLQVPL